MRSSRAARDRAGYARAPWRIRADSTFACGIGLSSSSQSYEFLLDDSPQIIFGEGFPARQQALHSFVAGVPKRLLIGETTALTPSISLRRNFADPNAASSTGGSTGARLRFNLSDTASVISASDLDMAEFAAGPGIAAKGMIKS